MRLDQRPTEEVVLGSGAIEIGVLPQLGARLHRLRVDGHDLLRTPSDVSLHRREPFFWGAFPMAPWCNRLDAGPLNFQGETVNLQANFRDGSAIHGQVYARAWNSTGPGEFWVEGGGDGWPWEYRTALGLQIEGRTVRIDQSLTNLTDAPMPGGLGIHPWYRRPVRVAINGTAVHPLNSGPVPAEPVSGRLDLRKLKDMPSGIDATWTRLAEPAAELYWPTWDLRAVIRVVGRQRYVVAASPPDKNAIAIEPQTHAPFGLTRLLKDEDGGLALIEPGEHLQLTTELEFFADAGGARDE